MSIYLEERNSFISMRTIPSAKSFHHCVYLNLAHILIAYWSHDIFFHIFKCVFLLSLLCGVLRSEKVYIMLRCICTNWKGETGDRPSCHTFLSPFKKNNEYKHFMGHFSYLLPRKKQIKFNRQRLSICCGQVDAICGVNRELKKYGAHTWIMQMGAFNVQSMLFVFMSSYKLCVCLQNFGIPFQYCIHAQKHWHILSPLFFRTIISNSFVFTCKMFAFLWKTVGLFAKLLYFHEIFWVQSKCK